MTLDANNSLLNEMSDRIKLIPPNSTAEFVHLLEIRRWLGLDRGPFTGRRGERPRSADGNLLVGDCGRRWAWRWRPG